MKHSLLFLLLLVWSVACVKREDFKTCEQSGFCRRLRQLPALVGGGAANPFEAVDSSFDAGVFSARIAARGASVDGRPVEFRLDAAFLESGAVRITLDEVGGVGQRYNEASRWILARPAVTAAAAEFDVRRDHVTCLGTGIGVRLERAPLRLTVERGGQADVILNEHDLLNMEFLRRRDSDVAVANDTFLAHIDAGSYWEEGFRGHTDSKPKGPEAFSLDVSFPGYAHVFGIPEHASPFSLRETHGRDEYSYKDPYRLYNLDVFEYETDSEMALYGSIPLMQAARPGAAVGVFFMVASELWVDIEKENNGVHTHWIAESGIIDILVFLEKTPADVVRHYTDYTGKAQLPQEFSIGYHQSRWNYLSQDDVDYVQRQFDAHDMPLDVLWLDLEYAKDRKYMVWDDVHFSKPNEMLAKLDANKRKLVTIIDPHFKRADDYYVFKEAEQKALLVKNADGKSDYDAWGWPGSCAWIDVFNPASHSWWSSLFSLAKYAGSAPNLFVWNDLNEPVVFNGPEISMPKDVIHYGQWEHRDVHNIYGMIFHNLTAQGLIDRETPAHRPFVLTRSFFAGSQRYGAMWTGDNFAKWEHLETVLPMVSSIGISGMPFSGADVGGFFGNPSEEMLTRWYQLGSIMPFFRGHAHIDTKRREPYLFEEPTRSYLRDALRFRYKLLPAFYTAFHEASVSGLPVIRPQLVVFPDDEAGYEIDDQAYLGSSGLLFKPVVTEGSTSVEVYLSDNAPYYHYTTHQVYHASKKDRHVVVDAPIHSLPALVRGGSIIPRRDTVRRSTRLMQRDPLTLLVALDDKHAASGTLYLDDGETFDYAQGDYLHRRFSFSKGVLRSEDLSEKAASATFTASFAPVSVRKVIVLGLKKQPTCVHLRGDKSGLAFSWKDATSNTASELTVADAGVSVLDDFELVFETTKAKKCTAAAPVDWYAQTVSAECGNTQFFCPNRGHLSQCLLPSRVGDGLCDCCDGSDEAPGVCANTCAEAGRAYRDDIRRKKEQVEKGLKVRDGYVTYATAERNKARAFIEEKEDELIKLTREEVRLRKRVEELESKGESQVEEIKGTELYGTVTAMQDAITALEGEKAALRKHIDELKHIMEELSTSFNPNYQDMAVLGATRAFKEWRDGAGESEGAVKAGAPSAEFMELASKNVVDLIQSQLSGVAPLKKDDTRTLFVLEHYLPPSLLPYYVDAKLKLVETLVRFNIIGPVAPEPVATGHSRAEKELSEVEKKKGALERTINEKKAWLESDWGAEGEWLKLNGECISMSDGEYEYELCLFNKVSQINKSNARTSLGSFKSREQNSHVYDNGQRCWNGPNRSAKVTFVCGEKNKILSVIEPEKCEYLFTVASPAACDAALLKEYNAILAEHTKDEL